MREDVGRPALRKRLHKLNRRLRAEGAAAALTAAADGVTSAISSRPGTPKGWGPQLRPVLLHSSVHPAHHSAARPLTPKRSVPQLLIDDPTIPLAAAEPSSPQATVGESPAHSRCPFVVTSADGSMTSLLVDMLFDCICLAS